MRRRIGRTMRSLSSDAHSRDPLSSPGRTMLRIARRSPLFRTGIDDLPKVHAVLDFLHFGGEPAIAANPVLHRIRIIGHQIRGPLGARDLDAEGERLVVVGLVETETRARRHPNLVHRYDAEYQRAGGIADAVDDPPLVVIADV